MYQMCDGNRNVDSEIGQTCHSESAFPDGAVALKQAAKNGLLTLGE